MGTGTYFENRSVYKNLQIVPEKDFRLRSLKNIFYQIYIFQKRVWREMYEIRVRSEGERINP